MAVCPKVISSRTVFTQEKLYIFGHPLHTLTEEEKIQPFRMIFFFLTQLIHVVLCEKISFLFGKVELLWCM